MAARILIGIAAVATVAIDALYLSIIWSQGGPAPPDVYTVPFIAGYLLLAAVVLTSSLVAPQGVRPPLRAAAATGLLILAVLSLFSIGMVVLVVAILATSATVLALLERHTPQVLGATVFASIIGLAVLVTGLQLSWQHIVCPASGQSSGTTVGFFGTVSYECDNGRLTLR